MNKNKKKLEVFKNMKGWQKLKENTRLKKRRDKRESKRFRKKSKEKWRKDDWSTFTYLFLFDFL